jgi:hypothetical protein
MSLSDYQEAWIINWLRGTTAPAAPATIYVALFTADPTEAGVFTNEVAAAVGYARTAITLTAPPSPVSNSADVVFPTATGAGWGTVTHAALVDNATRATGNVLASNALGASQAVAAGITPRFVAGQLTFTLD